MTKPMPRDTMKDAPASSDPPEDKPAGAGINTSIERLDGPLPKYVFEQAQSAMADAARHHVDPMTPPPAADVHITEARVEIEPTPVPKGPSTNPGIGPDAAPRQSDTIDRKIEAAMRAPVDDPIDADEQALLNRMRMREHLGGVATDPDAHAIKRRNTVLVVVAIAALIAVGLTWALHHKSTPNNDVNTTATQTSTTQTVPTAPTTAPTPTQTATTPPTATATNTAPIRSVPTATTKPTVTSTAPTTTTPATTQTSSAAPANSDHPMTHLLGEPEKK
jgi:hypothetical protein